MNQQTNQQESLFHDRAALVITDLLNQIGITKDKVKMIGNIAGMVPNVPPFIFSMMGLPHDVVMKQIKDLEPLLKMAEEHEDPAYFLRAVPEEKMTYFINQVITRLEWIKNGNENGHQSE